MPAWIVDNLKSARSLRILARCWVASWAAFVLMIPGPSLRVLGQAAFFSCMLTLMVPPSMPFFIFVLAFGMLVVGALFGWAWGCAAAAAASRARSQQLLQSAVQRVRSGAASATNPEAYVTPPSSGASTSTCAPPPSTACFSCSASTSWPSCRSSCPSSRSAPSFCSSCSTS